MLPQLFLLGIKICVSRARTCLLVKQDWVLSTSVSRMNTPVSKRKFANNEDIRSQTPSTLKRLKPLASVRPGTASAAISKRANLGMFAPMHSPSVVVRCVVPESVKVVIRSRPFSAEERKSNQRNEYEFSRL